MVLVLTFGVVLLVTVALSGPAARSVLSTAPIFLVAGALVGDGFLDLITVTPEGVSELTTFAAVLVFGALLTPRSSPARLSAGGSWPCRRSRQPVRS